MWWIWQKRLIFHPQILKTWIANKKTKKSSLICKIALQETKAYCFLGPLFVFFIIIFFLIWREIWLSNVFYRLMRCTSISTVQYGQTKRFWTNALCLPWYLLLNGGSIRSSSHHAHDDLTAAGSSFIIPWFLSCFCDATLWMRSSWIAVWLCRSVEALIWKRFRKLRSFSLVKCFSHKGWSSCFVLVYEHLLLLCRNIHNYLFIL